MANQKAKPTTLTQAAFAMRKIILFGGFGLLTLIVGRVFLEAAVAYWKATHPEPPPPPTVGFGILPKLVFSEQENPTLTYKLDMTSQRLRPFSDRARVFFQPSKRANLLALERAGEQAKTLGFLFEPDRISDEVYRWRRTTPIPGVLDYNIVTGTFALRVDWQSDPNFLQQNRLPNEDDAISTTRQLLSSVGLLSKDIATGSAKVSYLRADTDGFTNTVSFSESDFLEVNIFRTDINSQFKVLTEKPSQGTIRAVISGNSDRSQQLVSLIYNYLPVDYEVVHTYPIITPSQAFEVLSSGNGYVAALAPDQTDIVIRNIYLAYYDSGKQQQYMQPIYVLEGDGGYVGYVPAIDSTWITQ